MNTLVDVDFDKVIAGDYQITDLPSYVEYKKKAGQNGVTVDEIQRLSPDTINSCSFWQWIENHPKLAKDAIAFGTTEQDSIEKVNLINFNIACQMGVLNFILMNRHIAGMPVLDIGPGYGMLKHFIQNSTQFVYHGVDAYPKIDGVLKVGDDGSTLPESIMNTRFGMVISTNVFQHLSVRQRRHYYEQIAKILEPKCGIFTVTNAAVVEGSPVKYFRGEDGKNYMCHYGQYTEVQPINEIVVDLSKHFNILTINQRMFDCYFAFHCIIKPSQPLTNMFQKKFERSGRTTNF